MDIIWETVSCHCEQEAKMKRGNAFLNLQYV